MKKPANNKPEKIKALLEKVGLDLTEDQIHTFITTFELQKKEAIEEAIKPFQTKMEEYQKRNFELAGALEELTRFKDHFEKVLEEKTKQIEAIKVPEMPNIEEAVNKVIKERMDLLEKKIVKIDEAANKINEKVLPLNMAEDIKKINDVGNVFANYKDVLAKALVEMESSEIKALKEKVAVAEKKAADAEKKVAHLQEQVIRERQSTEITLLMENSPLDAQEKEHLYKYYEKVGHEEGKNEIEKFISMKETKEREKPVQRSFVRENAGGVKPMNETGILRKGTRLMGESTSFSREIEEWAEKAGV